MKRKQYSAVSPSDLYQSPRYKTKFRTAHVNPPSSRKTDTSSNSRDEVATSSKASFWREEEKKEEHDGAEDWERHESFNNDVGTQVGRVNSGYLNLLLFLLLISVGRLHLCLFLHYAWVSIRYFEISPESGIRVALQNTYVVIL